MIDFENEVEVIVKHARKDKRAFDTNESKTTRASQILVVAPTPSPQGGIPSLSSHNTSNPSRVHVL